MDIRDFASFLEVVFAINIAISVWNSFATTFTLQKLWQRQVSSGSHESRIKILLLLDSISAQLGRTVRIEEEFEREVAAYNEVSLKILKAGRIYGGIAAASIILMLWYIGYVSGGGETGVSAWVIYAVSAFVALPIPLTCLLMLGYGLTRLFLIMRVRKKKIEDIIRREVDGLVDEDISQRYSPDQP